MVRLTFYLFFLTAGTLAPVFSTEKIDEPKGARYLFYVAPTGNDQWSGELAAANPSGGIFLHPVMLIGLFVPGLREDRVDQVAGLLKGAGSRVVHE